MSITLDMIQLSIYEYAQKYKDNQNVQEQFQVILTNIESIIAELKHENKSPCSVENTKSCTNIKRQIQELENPLKHQKRQKHNSITLSEVAQLPGQDLNHVQYELQVSNNNTQQNFHGVSSNCDVSESSNELDDDNIYNIVPKPAPEDELPLEVSKNTQQNFHEDENHGDVRESSNEDYKDNIYNSVSAECVIKLRPRLCRKTQQHLLEDEESPNGDDDDFSENCVAKKNELLKNYNTLPTIDIIIDKIQNCPHDLSMIDLHDTMQKYIDSDQDASFQLGKELLVTDSRIEIPRKLVFLGLYRTYKNSSKSYQKSIRVSFGQQWNYFRSVAKKLTNFVEIFGSKHAILFLSNIPIRDIHNCSFQKLNELKIWWEQQDKDSYPNLPEVEELYKRTVLEKSPKAVDIFRRFCLGKQTQSQTDETAHSLFSCPVCLDSYNRSNKIANALGCGHGVCSSCISRIKKKECPLCRSPIDSVKVLYL